ncbi:MAG: MerR family transcriptional regulator [Sporolactobacillus sp.]
MSIKEVSGMNLSIGEFAKRTGLSIDTLRYYEKEGLIHPQRSANNRRIYSEIDETWMNFILRLKATAMPIKKIKEYARLRYLGDGTTQERLDILYAHRAFMREEEKHLHENMEHLNQKIASYEKQVLNKKTADSL